MQRAVRVLVAAALVGAGVAPLLSAPQAVAAPAVVRTPHSPQAIAVTPDGRQAYVATARGIAVHDISDRRVTRRIRLQGHPRGIAFDSTGTRAVVVGARTAFLIDVGSSRVVRAIPLPCVATGLAVVGDHDRGRAYVGCSKTAALVVFSVQSGQRLGRVRLPGPTHALTAAGRRIFVLARSGAVAVVDTVAGRVVRQQPRLMSAAAMTIAASPDGSTLILAGSAGVGVVDTATWKVTRVAGAAAPTGARAIAVTRDGSYGLIASSMGSRDRRGVLQVIDLAAPALVAHEFLAVSPRAIALTPDGTVLAAGGHGRRSRVVYVEPKAWHPLLGGWPEAAFELDVLNMGAVETEFRMHWSRDWERGVMDSQPRDGVPAFPAGWVAAPTLSPASTYQLNTDTCVADYPHDKYFYVEIREAHNPSNWLMAKFVLRWEALDLCSPTWDLPRMVDVHRSGDLRLSIVELPDVRSGWGGRWRLMASQDVPHPPAATALSRVDTSLNGAVFDRRTMLATFEGLQNGTSYRLSCSGSNTPVIINGETTTPAQLAAGLWTRADHRGRVSFLLPIGQSPPTCSLSAPSNSLSGKRLTRAPREDDDPSLAYLARPIYRFSLAPTTLTYDSELPSQVPFAPYTVEVCRARVAFLCLDPTLWATHGQVRPSSRPQVDRMAKSVTFGAATFYFQDDQGATPVMAVRVSGNGYGASTPVAVADLPAPSLDDSTLPASELDIASATAPDNATAVLPANGVVQERLTLSLAANGRPLDPTQYPILTELYDHAFFRDSSGRLVTGVGRADDTSGSTVVTPVPGPYVNTPAGRLDAGPVGGAGTASTVYLTTTAPTSHQVTPYIVANQAWAGNQAVRALGTTTTAELQGTAAGGLQLGCGGAGGFRPCQPADANGPAGALYRSTASDGTTTNVVMTDYRVITSASKGQLPLAYDKTAYEGRLTLGSDWLIRLVDGTGPSDSQLLATSVVSTTGEFVWRDDLPSR